MTQLSNEICNSTATTQAISRYKNEYSYIYLFRLHNESIEKYLSTITSKPLYSRIITLKYFIMKATKSNSKSAYLVFQELSTLHLKEFSCNISKYIAKI